MGNILKGFAEMLSQSGNIIDALTSSQAIAGAKPAFDVSKTNILTADNSSSPFSDDNTEVLPRSGAVIGLDGAFRQLAGSSNYYLENLIDEPSKDSPEYNNYYIKGKGSKNLICTPFGWSKDNAILIKYVEALAKSINAQEMNRLIDYHNENSSTNGYKNIEFIHAERKGIADISNTTKIDLENSVSIEGIPSGLLLFYKFSDWKLNIYNSPECLNYFFVTA
jgi:hypothetical protein